MTGLINLEALTGQSKFVIDVISIPIFSGIAGLLTNWTGVLMLFAPVRFTGFYVPGLKTLFPLMPRILQILPTFAPGGILGFQGFIPARAEKMASIAVDKGLAKVGSIKDIARELDLEGIAEHLAVMARRDIRPMVDSVMEREEPDLWYSLPPQIKEMVYSRVENELPGIAKRAFVGIGDNIDQLLSLKMMAVGYLRKNPGILKDFIYELGAPELRFMVKIGILGAPMGFFLALLLQAHPYLPILSHVSAALFVLTGAALIGIIVNIIAIKMVFVPGDPQPRYKYLWKQALLARRQHDAAASFGRSLAFLVVTVPNIAHELLNGPAGDKTRMMLESILGPEVDRIVGPFRGVVRVAVGTREFDAIRASTTGAALGFAPKIIEDAEFSRKQSEKISVFATAKLQALPPSEFMDMLYSAIEQDAWLLYAHGGLLGLGVGSIHLLLFGA